MEVKRLVMCTSTGCLEYLPKEYQDPNIDILRIHLHFRDKEYLDGSEDSIRPEELYRIMEEEKRDVKVNLPHTSMPTSDEISKHFQNAIDNGYSEVFVVCISSGMGGTYNFVDLVANNFRDKLKIHVIDSKNVSFNEGYLALLAQKMINEGKSSDDILKEIEWTKRHQVFLGLSGKLDYLIYNGRLKGGKAYMGKMLKICPVLHFNSEGELVPLYNRQGVRKATEAAIDSIKEIIADRDEKDYYLLHSYTGRSVVDLMLQIEQGRGVKTNFPDVLMTPVSGIQTGPWLAGYIYIPIRREDELLDL